MANTLGKTAIHGPNTTGTITPGSNTTGNPTTGQSGANAGQKTTINTPGKTANYGSGNGVGANTPVKRKKPRRLGTNMGNTPA